MPVHIEKIFPCKIIAKPDEHVFLRLNLDQEIPLSGNTMPMLFAPVPHLHVKYWDEPFFAKLINDHVQAAKRLKHAGYTSCVIAADNDGCLQKILSPRFSLDALDLRIKHLLTIYQALSDVMEEVWVSLTLEELAPGGFDPSDGVFLAKKLESLGLNNLIVTCGTRDFSPLYDRRPTQKKRPEHEDFCSHEPGLASTLWVLEHTQLKIWYSGFIQSRPHALALAQQLGLSGIIDRIDLIGP